MALRSAVLGGGLAYGSGDINQPAGNANLRALGHDAARSAMGLECIVAKRVVFVRIDNPEDLSALSVETFDWPLNYLKS